MAVCANAMKIYIQGKSSDVAAHDHREKSEGT